jgi:hypothetical protein
MLPNLALVVLTSLIIQCVFLYSNTIPPETVWPTDTTIVSNDDTQLIAYSVQVFAGSKVTVFQKTNLMVDVNFKKTIVADKTQISWGVICEMPDCSKGMKPESSSYGKFSYQYVPAQGLFALTNQKDLNETQSLARLNFDFMQEIPFNWPFNGMGILGMAPDSDFLAYLTNNFGDVSVAMHFVPNEKTQLGQPAFKLNVYLNHEESQMIQTHKLKLPSKWVLDGSIEGTETTGNFEMNFQAYFVMAFVGADKFCSTQLANVCPKDETCTEDNANFHQAQKFKFKIQNTDYVIYPEEYLKFSKDKLLTCNMKELKDELHSLDIVAQLGIGYLIAHTPVYSIKGGVPSIAFLRFFDIKDDYSLFWPLCGVFGVSAMILLCMILYVNRKRSQMSDDYVNFES